MFSGNDVLSITRFSGYLSEWLNQIEPDALKENMKGFYHPEPTQSQEDKENTITVDTPRTTAIGDANDTNFVRQLSEYVESWLHDSKLTYTQGDLEGATYCGVHFCLKSSMPEFGPSSEQKQIRFLYKNAEGKLSGFSLFCFVSSPEKWLLSIIPDLSIKDEGRKFVIYENKGLCKSDNSVDSGCINLSDILEDLNHPQIFSIVSYFFDSKNRVSLFYCDYYLKLLDDFFRDKAPDEGKMKVVDIQCLINRLPQNDVLEHVKSELPYEFSKFFLDSSDDFMLVEDFLFYSRRFLDESKENQTETHYNFKAEAVRVAEDLVAARFENIGSFYEPSNVFQKVFKPSPLCRLDEELQLSDFSIVLRHVIDRKSDPLRKTPVQILNKILERINDLKMGSLNAHEIRRISEYLKAAMLRLREDGLKFDLEWTLRLLQKLIKIHAFFTESDVILELIELFRDRILFFQQCYLFSFLKCESQSFFLKLKSPGLSIIDNNNKFITPMNEEAFIEERKKKKDPYAVILSELDRVFHYLPPEDHVNGKDRLLDLIKEASQIWTEFLELNLNDPDLLKATETLFSQCSHLFQFYLKNQVLLGFLFDSMQKNIAEIPERSAEPFMRKFNSIRGLYNGNNLGKVEKECSLLIHLMPQKNSFNKIDSHSEMKAYFSLIKNLNIYRNEEFLENVIADEPLSYRDFVYCIIDLSDWLTLIKQNNGNDAYIRSIARDVFMIFQDEIKSISQKTMSEPMLLDIYKPSDRFLQALSDTSFQKKIDYLFKYSQHDSSRSLSRFLRYIKDLIDKILVFLRIKRNRKNLITPSQYCLFEARKDIPKAMFLYPRYGSLRV